MPRRVGYTVLEASGLSPSFRREITFDPVTVKFVIEYAIYWDFDITHLYDLEHIWIFVCRDGAVADCECSFHGRYLKGLLGNGANLEDGTHVRLYSQPGKHPFSPIARVFELLPDFWKVMDEKVGPTVFVSRKTSPRGDIGPIRSLTPRFVNICNLF